MAGSYDDRDGKIWLDGKLVEWREANVHILTHALHYASSVFEGERAYNGKIFKSHQNQNLSCVVMRITLSPPRNETDLRSSTICKSCRKKHGGDSHVITVVP